MSKVINATCEAGVVTAFGVPIDGVELFSEGVGASEGILIQEAGKVYYLANVNGDLKTTLTKLTAALTELTTALTALDAKPVGGSGSAPAPAVASNVANITSANAELQTLMEALK